MMVFLTRILLKVKELKKPRAHLRGAFTDSLRLYVKGGCGGNGLPKYGGVGGQGGEVKAIGRQLVTLDDIVKSYPFKRISAGNGHDSHPKSILGLPGEDRIVEVPLGVTVIREDGKTIGEINEVDDEVVLAWGGVGGASNNGYLGVKGKSYMVTLDLKLIADVGLVGFPNAGKSTLLKAISNAKPRIASYPFTTIRPNVGVLKYKDERSISMADLPGLIEGAHANIGMGHRFLKHVERTKLLLLVVDINGFKLSPKHEHRSCLDTVVLLNKELELYRSDLLDKPALIVINKMDTDGALDKFNEIKTHLRNLSNVFSQYPEEFRPERPLVFDDVLAISAKSKGAGVEMVKNRLRELLDFHAETPEDEPADFYKKTSDQMKERGAKLV